ncbi:hypothetical protein FQR65_LT07756 [Abscondita terminalis]|nr:hypothetical protein FQR65_LT07756 [Abscondita terminalis]
MTEQVVMTQQQLEQLIATIRSVTVSANENETTMQSQTTGMWHILSHDFLVVKMDVDAFVNAICVYKECVNVTHANALRGIPMLLDKLAATWWQGTKNSVGRWEQSLTALRHSFGKKQTTEHDPADVYVNNARALLSCLPAKPVLHNTINVDMIYSLLNKKTRNRLYRDDVKSFDDLIERISNRITEVTKYHRIQEKMRTSLKCNADRVKAVISTPVETGNQTSSSVINCFGCGTPEFVRSNCPKCRQANNTRTREVSQVELMLTDSEPPAPRINDNSVKVILRADGGTQLNDEDEITLQSFLNENIELFREQLDATPYIEHSIQLTDDTLISVPPYRLSPVKTKALKTETNKLTKQQKA